MDLRRVVDRFKKLSGGGLRSAPTEEARRFLQERLRLFGRVGLLIGLGILLFRNLFLERGSYRTRLLW